jgi:hypothetical protein
LQKIFYSNLTFISDLENQTLNGYLLSSSSLFLDGKGKADSKKASSRATVSECRAYGVPQ